MNKKTTVYSAVNAKLAKIVEAKGIVDAFTTIKNYSEYQVETFCLEFRLEYGHQLRPYKDGTVNRYMEQWLKANAPLK
jgi:response regulator of citrate/malate metabolism